MKKPLIVTERMSNIHSADDFNDQFVKVMEQYKKVGTVKILCPPTPANINLKLSDTHHKVVDYYITLEIT